MDIPPPPPPPPSSDDAPPSQPPHDAPTSPYAGLPSYPQKPYDQQGGPPYSGPGQPTYGGPSSGGPGPYGSVPPPYSGQQPPGSAPPYGGQAPYPGQAPYSGQPPYGGQGPHGGQAPYGGNPYGGQNPYGPQPYPGYPQTAGWYNPQANTNGMAIASLVVGFTCIPVLGVIFGLVALSQIKKRGERGKGLAIAGLILNGVATVLLAVFIALGVAGAFDDGNTRVDRIRVGQCFNTVDSSLGDYGGDGARSTTVDVVDCSEEHDAEAYAIFTVDAADDGGYPGTDRISAVAESKCASYADDYADGTPWEKSADVYYYMPPADGWRRGDHKVTCFFGATHGSMTGSVKDGGTNSGFGV
ncbi:DUF4190 domain-containing protein [Streptomyces sp. NPDC003300]|uniref:DUF4190 domain-containing protein n=1 Tax=unclassified Streptomyces TaxID=2593676 RepID=UPI0033B561A4